MDLHLSRALIDNAKVQLATRLAGYEQAVQEGDVAHRIWFEGVLGYLVREFRSIIAERLTVSQDEMVDLFSENDIPDTWMRDRVIWLRGSMPPQTEARHHSFLRQLEGFFEVPCTRCDGRCRLRSNAGSVRNEENGVANAGEERGGRVTYPPNVEEPANRDGERSARDVGRVGETRRQQERLLDALEYVNYRAEQYREAAERHEMVYQVLRDALDATTM